MLPGKMLACFIIDKIWGNYNKYYVALKFIHPVRRKTCP